MHAHTRKANEPMKILVCGGRDYYDSVKVYRILDALHAKAEITLLVHGDARGADTLAGMWAKDRKVPCMAYPANWTKHGTAAGPIRNKLMLKLEKPEIVVAFPGGSGTAHMRRIAENAGIPDMKIEENK